MKKGLGRAEARSSDLASRFSMTLFGVLPAPTGISFCLCVTLLAGESVLPPPQKSERRERPFEPQFSRNLAPTLGTILYHII